ncbi:MAG: hypothetical protein JOZ24_08460 [Candidatus Eremiobacteraeota bacterium]|nr:hypothetical protein [Candidatus Eremiobacteraeota bacterium]
MAQFIALVRRDLERFSEADFTPLLEPEAERARQLYAHGLLRAIWSRGDAPGAVLLFEVESLDDVNGALDSLPLKAKGMLTVDAIVPLTPYRGFGPRSA